MQSYQLCGYPGPYTELPRILPSRSYFYLAKNTPLIKSLRSQHRGALPQAALKPFQQSTGIISYPIPPVANPQPPHKSAAILPLIPNQIAGKLLFPLLRTLLQKKRSRTEILYQRRRYHCCQIPVKKKPPALKRRYLFVYIEEASGSPWL